MRTLRAGMSGEDVELWEYFLRGQGFYWLEVDGKFDPGSVEATKDYQRERGLKPDGVVGRMTYSAAFKDGFDPLEDGSLEEDGPNWPAPPDFKPLIGNDARAQVFGRFRYAPAGSSGNPEAVRVLDGWYADNVVQVEIPQLAGVEGAAGLRKFAFHRLAATQVAGFFQAVEKAGLLDRILSWGGSYSARFIRGSRSVLSNHSFGSAFDVNVPWNWLGAQPALAGRRGSVRELVPIAHRFGLYWGGHFRRKDGMHFEVAKVMDADGVRKALEAV